MYCPSCGEAAEQGAGYCAACGTPLPKATTGTRSSALPPTPPNPPTVPAALAGPTPLAAAPAPVTTIEIRRLGIGDLIALAGTFILFASLFLPWYTLSFTLSSVSGTEFASIAPLGDGAGGWRYLLFVVCLLVMMYLFARTMIGHLTHRLPLPHWQLLTTLCAVNVLLAILAFCVKPGGGTTVSGLSLGWDYGAFLGLSASVLALVGALIRRSDPELRDSTTPYTSTRSAPTAPTAPSASSAPSAYSTRPTDASTPTAPGYAAPPKPSRPARTGSRSLIHHQHR